MSTPLAGVGPESPHRPDPGSPEPPGDELDALVDQILGAKPRPVDWTRLSGEAAEQAWAALDAWVGWLVRRYAIDPREIPPCWAEHGDLFEELSALHAARRAAYDPAGPANGPSDWHHVLANTRARLQVAVARTGCRTGQHRAARTPEWARAGA